MESIFNVIDDVLATFESDELRIIALIVLTISVVGYLFFREGPLWAKMICFGLLLSGGGLLIFSLSVGSSDGQSEEHRNPQESHGSKNVSETGYHDEQSEEKSDVWEEFKNAVEERD
ncbi:MAG: hypothetical protein ACFB2Z_11545 [Maricaulaceae bacterium]